MNIDFTSPTTIIILLFLLTIPVDILVLKYVANKNKVAPLKVGAIAPEFDLKGTYGRQIRLADYRGQNVVLVFYPMDQTPGCTQQLCSLRDDYSQLQSVETEVLAINGGNQESHEAFAKKQNYSYPLLVDENGLVSKAYGVAGPFGLTQRTVFLIDKQGVIQWIFSGIQDNQELLTKIKELS
jgi:peroxiredoxin Q/BCP